MVRNQVGGTEPGRWYGTRWIVRNQADDSRKVGPGAGDLAGGEGDLLANLRGGERAGDLDPFRPLPVGEAVQRGAERRRRLWPPATVPDGAAGRGAGGHKGHVGECFL